MKRMADPFLAVHAKRMNRESENLERWIGLRADEICGRASPQTADLFGPQTPTPPWRTALPPIDRLAAFACDADNPSARRRDANSVVELHQHRIADRGDRTTLQGPALQHFGMLMLVPRKAA
ncbi:MAG: hypothetical protein JO227_05160, partial [Acetobacteraceae bacterium]|nr:hypothetical protein [Acetobacteraceae bacterium]